jgi:hypothetical protein
MLTSKQRVTKALKLGVDVVPLGPPETLFGFVNEGWKEWKLFDGSTHR